MSDVKTLAIRLDGDLHNQLTILAKLTGISITDAIRTAIEKEVEAMAANPETAAKASKFQDAIARQADEQRAAIEALFGTTPVEPSKPRTARKSATS
ncbi:type II toxin-antitoxin system VapB family antitoxin [Flexivirga caeni]|uniref:DNA-binding protein n=1 Tax=Flexivirga caeni TaxID=2294115 RepID=A0A3M9MBY4_9MICO|nr:type II toxin-antitoxin system VapB family antitoxin [Flexivirga caeni]RNI23079.1 DNA-binding protein [Flexivirga caeni]